MVGFLIMQNIFRCIDMKGSAANRETTEPLVGYKASRLQFEHSGWFDPNTCHSQHTCHKCVQIFYRWFNGTKNFEAPPNMTNHASQDPDVYEPWNQACHNAEVALYQSRLSSQAVFTNMYYKYSMHSCLRALQFVCVCIYRNISRACRYTLAIPSRLTLQQS